MPEPQAADRAAGRCWLTTPATSPSPPRLMVVIGRRFVTGLPSSRGLRGSRCRPPTASMPGVVASGHPRYSVYPRPTSLTISGTVISALPVGLPLGMMEASPTAEQEHDRVPDRDD